MKYSGFSPFINPISHSRPRDIKFSSNKCNIFIRFINLTITCHPYRINFQNLFNSKIKFEETGKRV